MLLVLHIEQASLRPGWAIINITASLLLKIAMSCINKLFISWLYGLIRINKSKNQN